MKLYTKTGDDGTTGLFGGQRVAKDDFRVVAYGELDELNALLGLALSVLGNSVSSPALRQIQSELFVIGAELATPGGPAPSGLIGDAHVRQLECWIDEADAALTPLRNFILPGGSPAAAHLHFARTVCRRAERAVVGLSHREFVRPTIVTYLNRLSDLLFVWARKANQDLGVADIPWAGPRA